MVFERIACPGAVDTPLLRNQLENPGYRAATVPAILMKRIVRPEEIANVVLPIASYVTGTTIVVGGRLTAKTGIPRPPAS